VLKGDHLKRGAGIITCIVTKIRKGETNRALLHFKSWDHINAELERTLTHFPLLNWGQGETPFDIRRQDHRQGLHQALEALSGSLLFEDGSRNANSMLLSCYLGGYDRVAPWISGQSPMASFEADQFERHQEFVSQDALSVYLHDVQLEIATDGLEPGVELADCQGSDSPNPLHLAMIQEYLLEAHLIVYVISSRTGLRQADIKFLTMIHKMGLMDTVLFVVNVDFTEHEGQADLQALVKRVTEELSLIKSLPPVFAFSALYNLFESNRRHLGEKDRQRLAQWQQDAAMVCLSDGQTARFMAVLQQKLTRERGALLLKNHLERLVVTLDAIGRWISLNQQLRQADDQGRLAFLAGIKRNQKRIAQVSDLLKSTFNGAAQKIKNSLRQEVDRLFYEQGATVSGTFAFIRNYAIDPYRCTELLTKASFAQTLYLVFQEFRQALETYLATTVNPEIFRAIGELEKDLHQRLIAVADPHLTMIGETIHYLSSGPPAAMPAAPDAPPTSFPGLDAVKQIAEVHLEPASANLRFSARIRTEALFKWGFYAAVRLARRVFQKGRPQMGDDKLMALRDGVWRMKQETEEAVRFHFKSYRENIKFQYLFKLVDTSAEVLYTVLVERFEVFNGNFEAMAAQIDRRAQDDVSTLESLGRMQTTVEDIGLSLNALRSQLQRLQQ
jgi:hypothetical protein